jgi:hypothetical protein
MLTFSFCAGTPDGGGAESTLGLLHAFVLAMVLHPDVQMNAPHEIALVVGSDRLPGLQE